MMALQWWVAAAFFLSGFSALLYQVVWQRMLVLFTGSDAQSVVIVITAYLAGLGLGSLNGGVLADRQSQSKALLALACVELAIAVLAWFSPWFLADIAYPVSLTIEYGKGFAWAALFLLLLIPTWLMGLSLPLVSRVVCVDAVSAASRVSILNGVNIVGASTGCLVAGLFLAPLFGFEVAVKIGAVISFCAALIVIYAYYRVKPGLEIACSHASACEVSPYKEKSYWWFCLLFFLAGFAAISMEIIWFRMLSVILDPRPKIFTIMLFWFLLFDGLGSLVASRWIIKSYEKAFLLIQGLVMISAFLSMLGLWALIGRGDNFSFIRGLVKTYPDAWTLLMPAILIGPAAFLIGAGFPVMQAAVHQGRGYVGSRVAGLQLSNIMGNILAGVITGFVALEYIGTSATLHILFALILCLMARLCYLAWQAHSKRWMVMAASGCVLLAGCMAVMPSSVTLWKRLHYKTDSDAFLFHEDSSGVASLSINNGLAGLAVNGEPQGRIPFYEIHPYLGAVSVLIHPRPNDVLVVGLGSGGTAYGAGIRASSRKITVVELVSAEYPLIRRYMDYGRSPALENMFADSRYEWVRGDGRRYLGGRQAQYDIIEADAIMPYNAGSGFLYSREYFELAKSRLKPGGIMAQWLPTARTGVTFTDVFEYVILFDQGLLLGSSAPIVIDAANIKEVLFSASTTSYLASAGISPERLWAMSGAMVPLRCFYPDSPRITVDLNRDWYPADEYERPFTIDVSRYGESCRPETLAQ